MKAAHPLRFACRVALAFALVYGPAVHALEIPGYPASIDAYDPREVGMLPAYCKYTQVFRGQVPGGSNEAEIERWNALLGNTFHSLHHYCWGLMKTNRAVLLARTGQVREYYLNSAIEEFDYVLRNANDEFLLLPEILTKKGENLIRLGKGPIAVLHLERAATLKPDYWPPYAHLSDYYKTKGEVDKAEDYLRKGLSFSPQAKALTRRLSELQPAKARAQRSSRAGADR